MDTTASSHRFRRASSHGVQVTEITTTAPPPSRYGTQSVAGVIQLQPGVPESSVKWRVLLKITKHRQGIETAILSVTRYSLGNATSFTYPSILSRSITECLWRIWTYYSWVDNSLSSRSFLSTRTTQTLRVQCCFLFRFSKLWINRILFHIMKDKLFIQDIYNYSLCASVKS